MKIRKTKKGFTIVELVIVIAVIGILAAILIPTFVGLTNRANEASDNALVNNLNKALKVQEGEQGKKPETFQGAIDNLKKEGYLLEQLNTRSGKTLVWDMKEDQFVLNPTNEQTGANFWKIVENTNDVDAAKYSIYAGAKWTGNASGFKYGFDAGENTEIAEVNYTNNGAAQEVVIRTNGGKLLINSPLGTVHHYGEGLVLDISAIAGSSYHEHGYFPKASIKQGRLVVEDAGQIQVLDSSLATAPVTVEKTGKGEITNIVKGDNPNVEVAEDLEENISTIVSVSTWAALKAEVDNANGADVINVTTSISGATQSINIARDVTILGNGNSITGSVASKSAKVYLTTSYYGIFNVGNPDVATSGLSIFIVSIKDIHSN